MKDTDLDRFGELSGDAQIAVAQLVNAIASLGLNGDWADVEHWDEITAFVEDATDKVRTYRNAVTTVSWLRNHWPRPPGDGGLSDGCR